jgi:hypothetical protein
MIEDRDTIKYNDRQDKFACVFDLDEGTCFVSRTVFHFPQVNCDIAFLKDGTNGATFTHYDDLWYGITVVRDANKAIVFTKETQGPIKSDQQIIEQCSITGFIAGERIEENNTYSVTFWCTHAGERIEKTVQFHILRGQFDTPDTFERAQVNQMVYHTGYYPTDEEWAAHQKYLEPGTDRPTPPVE